jgi:hypothetical protein
MVRPHILLPGTPALPRNGDVKTEVAVVVVILREVSQTRTDLFVFTVT